MDQDLRIALRGLAAQPRSLVEFIKCAVPMMSQMERNTLRRELDRENQRNKVLSIFHVDDDGETIQRYNKKLRDCNIEELEYSLTRYRNTRVNRAIKAELRRRKNEREHRS